MLVVCKQQHALSQGWRHTSFSADCSASGEDTSNRYLRGSSDGSGVGSRAATSSCIQNCV